METEDRLLAQIDQMGKVLAKVMADVFHLQYNPDLSALRTEAYQALHADAGLDMGALLSMQPQSAVELLSTEKGFSETHLDQFADVLWELSRADRTEWDALNAEQHRQLALAYAIYQHLNRTSTLYSLERERRMGFIANGKWRISNG
jgi:hypothetical protein